MDADVFKQLVKPGFYRAEMFLINDNIIKTGVFLYGSVTAK